MVCRRKIRLTLREMQVRCADRALDCHLNEHNLIVSCMAPLVKNIISSCWVVFLVVWLLAAIFTKRTVYREGTAQRLRYMLPIAIGCYLLFRGYRLPYPFHI